MPKCQWCGRGFTPRRGGSAGWFCSTGHRNAYHSKLRRWAGAEIAAGRLTIDAVKNGSAVACTLPSSGNSGGAIPEARKSGAAKPAERAGGVVVAIELDPTTAMQVREACWGHPYHPAAPHEFAAAVVKVLRAAMPWILARP